MDMLSRQQYLADLRQDYIGAPKAVKTELLDEAEKRTHLARQYLITLLRPEAELRARPRRHRRPTYGAAVKAPLAKLWALFDYPCGQRLAPLLRSELQRLRAFGEILCSDAAAAQLQRISPKTIDRLLAGERNRLHLRRYRNPNLHPLLYQQIPIKLSTDWDRHQIGNLQLDFVAHCGRSAAGHFAHTLSADDIASGWWGGRALLGKSQFATRQAFDHIRCQWPFPIREAHPDNDSSLINDLLYNYCRQHHIRMSRSRPLHKNDNAWVEQRNWTHVRKIVGYRRFDTQAQVDLLNSLYDDLVLYKNFFQPTLKLRDKRRVRGQIHRRYEPAATPYQRLLDSTQLTSQQRRQLQQLYQSLNPAELKRRIEAKRDQLLALEENPAPKRQAPTRKMPFHLVRSYMTQPSAVWLGR